MGQIAILDPVFVVVLLLALSVPILLAIAGRRAPCGTDCGRANRHLAIGRAGRTDADAKRTANFRNQVELPVLFNWVVAMAPPFPSHPMTCDGARQPSRSAGKS